ncbi:hypothetical protein [Methanobacterium spitsbergense]|uniref:Uncharacterized protein n=1 Tax=Methanobacterium spitsbergense TaxID=2874285 RepID=A0A8T5V3D3_9EURY|nr:hypothetical protein [Methanobacterium spitsbergense]MBZ2166371.1 hypothetical protein [Methanobacterium spitsbergense]
MKLPGEISLVDGDCPNCGHELHRIGSFEDLGEYGEKWRKYKITCKFCPYETDWIDETQEEDLESEANSNMMKEAI